MSRITVILSLFHVISLTFTASALEPVTALDDGFTLPSQATMAAASMFYPGSEAFINGGFAVGAWQVPYGIEDLAVTTGLAGYGRGKFGAMLSWSGSGFDLYGDEQEKLGISYAPFRRLSAGIRLTRSAMRIRNFGNASAWSADIGTVFHPRDSIFVSAALEDIAGAELGDSKEPLDGRSRLGVSWLVPGEVTLLASLSKVRRFDPSLSIGGIVEIMDVLKIGVIGANEPDRFEFLCGLTIKSGEFTYRGNYHRDLGMTHGFSIRSEK